MFNIQKARHRAALFGGCGGVLGWILSQSIWGSPGSFVGAVVVGSMAGLGIGSMLGISEGVTSASVNLLKRGLIAGVLAGVLGGAAGAIVGQSGFIILSGQSSASEAEGQSRATVFSTDVSQRLAEAGAKSGEIEVSLIWENTNDLDLHVVDPTGERVFFQQPASLSGGELDVDRNASCAGAITSKPIEHVVWTGKSAPHGQYQVAVHHFMNCGTTDPTPYRLEVKIGDEIVASHKGQISYDSGIDHVQKVQTALEFGYPHSSTKDFGTNSSNTTAGIARLIGWLVFGVLVACAEGIKRRSRTAFINGVIGGAIGGGIGGVLFQMIVSLGLPDSMSRLAGFTVLGVCIGTLIAIVEQLRNSSLVIENGRFAGREIPIDRPMLRLGRSDALEVFVGGDRSILPHHATVYQQQGTITIASAEGEVRVNGSPVAQCAVTDGNRIQIGETVFVVRSRQVTSVSPAATAAATPVSALVPVATAPPVRKTPPPPVSRSTQTDPIPKSSDQDSGKPREPSNATGNKKLPPPPPKKTK